MRASARRRWRRRCFGSESRGFSIPIRAPLSPPRLSPASSRQPASRFRWTGRGRFMDNIFIERLWRSIKYEEVHLKAYADGREARVGIGSWMTFYNFRRPHQAMNNQMPMAVWRAGIDKIEAAARAVEMPLRMDNANALVSRPAELHRQPLAEPSVRLSPHWAPIRPTRRSCRDASARRGQGVFVPAFQQSRRRELCAPCSA